MADNIKSWATIKNDIAVNGNKSISPQHVTDAIHSIGRVWGGMYVAGGATATALSTSYATLDLADFTNHADSVGVAPDKANDRITLPAIAGIYEVTFSVVVALSAVTALVGLKAQLDGVDIPGGTWESWRSFAVAVGMPVHFTVPVNFTSGNGYITFQAKSASGTPSWTMSNGGIWVRRAA